MDITEVYENKLKLDIKHFNFEEMFAPIRNYYEMLCQEKKLILEIDNQIDYSMQVIGDEKRIGQILQHLLANAYKYTSKGKVKVTFICFIENDKYIMEFYVKDTGHGIPDERKDSLFKMFAVEF